MRILLLRDPAAFAQRAWDFLETRIECNILATVLSAVRSGALAGGEVSRREGDSPLFACVLDGSGRVQGAALRTPPRPLLVSPLAEDAADELIGSWLAEDPGLDAVNAVSSTARALAAAWAQRTGGRPETQMRMAMHGLRSVTDPPHPASGRLVPVVTEQLDTLIEWWAAFAAEADVGSDVASAGAVARARMDAGGAFFWEDEGRPVSLVAVNPAVAGVARVGPVYTPPSQRGRGYAGNAVAALSRRALAGGAECCALFTDLANPTSNKIYAEVGYRPLCEWETIALRPAGRDPTSASWRSSCSISICSSRSATSTGTPSPAMCRSEIIAAGVDGCRAGWVAAIALGDTTTELRLFADLEAVIRWRERQAGAVIVGVDVPMGLPPRAGPRACDRQARRELGPRWMCVFAPPDRELLGCDFAQARDVVHRRRHADPAGEHPVMTHQTINIAPKIAEADRVLRADPRRQEWLLEVHPELSFRALAGAPQEPKRTSTGAAARLALIAEQFPDAPRQLGARTWSGGEVARNDLLDAYAVLWTALRFTRGPGHYRELGDGARDAHGLCQRIVI